MFVRDYLAAQKFYYEVAGFHEAYRQPDNLASFVSNGNSYHDLTLVDLRSHYNKQGPDRPVGLNHIAFELETEVDLVAGYGRAVAAGMTFHCADHDVAHSLYTEDPEGNGVEFYADVMKDWRSNRHGVIIKQKPKYVPGVNSPANTERNYPVDPEILVVKDAMFRSKKCSHVGLIAADFPAMFRYYRDIAGLTPLCGTENSAFAILRGTHSEGDVTLLRKRPGLAPGLHHVGLMVWDESDLDRGAAAAAAAGIAVEQIDHPARRVVAITDPSGIRLQFFVNRDWRPEVIATVDAETALSLL